MKKTLLINGCSWSGGHEDIHDKNGNLNPQPNYVWPNKLTSRIRDYSITNLAVGGNSNDTILRQAIEFIDNNPVDAVIIQWTAMHRKEVYFEPVGEWGNLCNYFELIDPTDKLQTTDKAYTDKIMYAMHFDKNVEYTESVLNTIDKVTKSATDDYFWQYSETDYVVKYFQQLLVLQTYLENKCIPYMFTSMNASSHLPLMINKAGVETDYEKILASQLNLSNWTKRPLSFMVRDDIDDTLHPTSKGHLIIAAELTREFKRING